MNIAELSEKETPFYLYDTGILRNNLEKLKEASDRYNYKVHYAVKANANIPVLQMVKDYGFGVDCVSGGEIERSISAGFKGDQVVFAGVGKSDREIEIALSHNIFCFNLRVNCFCFFHFIFQCRVKYKSSFANTNAAKIWAWVSTSLSFYF